MLYIKFQENMSQNYKQDFRNEYYFNDKLPHGSTRNNAVAEVSHIKFTRICQTKTALINNHSTLKQNRTEMSMDRIPPSFFIQISITTDQAVRSPLTANTYNKNKATDYEFFFSATYLQIQPLLLYFSNKFPFHKRGWLQYISFAS
jgi:hypothetical protein